MYNKSVTNPLLYVVLAVTTRACVVWHVKEDKQGKIHFMPGSDALQDWMVAELELTHTTPTQSDAKCSLTLARKVGAANARKWNANRGFEALTLSQIVMLVKHLDVPIPDKNMYKQETELVTRLVRHVLGEDVSEAVLARALGKRHLVELPSEAVPPSIADVIAATQDEGEEIDSENELGDNAYIRSAWQTMRDTTESNAQKRFQTPAEF
eukprot:5971765-Amphidinium_carterae.1